VQKIMRIVEIGHTGVGKTTYMATLYGILQNGIEGFGLKAQNSNDHERLIELAQNISQGIYPSATDQRREYNFYLQYDNKNIFPFTWADYRGGAIRETQDSEQARLLVSDLRQADGIMMFCDGHALASGDIRSNQIGRMTALINKTLPYINRPISLAIILTKADLVTQFTESMLESFRGFFTAIEASPSISGCILPITCGIESHNVEKPLLFALQVAVNLQLKYLEKEIAEHEKMARYYQDKSDSLTGILHDIWKTIIEEPTYSDISNAKYQEVYKKRREYQPIISPVRALNKHIEEHDYLWICQKK